MLHVCELRSVVRSTRGELAQEGMRGRSVVDDLHRASGICPSSGDVAVSWYDTRRDPSNVKTEVFAAISSDGGQTFAPNTVVSAGSSDATDPDLEPFKGKVYVAIEGDQLKGQMSIPMAEAGLPAFRGRYLNGAGTFKLSVRNGLLCLTAQTIDVKGKTLPEVYMQKIRTENLARNLNSDPRASAALDRVQDIQVKDGKVVIVPKENQ